MIGARLQRARPPNESVAALGLLISKMKAMVGILA
jgi:hypothetical protein